MSEPTPAQRSWGERLGAFVREAVLLVVLLGVGVGVFGWLRGPRLPDLAPDLSLVALDGRPIELADLRGRTVVLNFWATWCAPCLAELPMLVAFADAHPEVTVVGVAIDEAGPVRARVERSQIRYPVAIGGQDVVDRYGVAAFPTTVVVDRDGRVRWSHTGMLFRPHLEAITAWASW